MKTWFAENYKNWAVYLIIGIFLRFISVKTESNFLNKFLTENLVLLLPALLAINITTMSIFLTKIHDLKKEFPRVSFREAIQAMKHSIWEQVILIIIAVLSLVLQGSKSIPLLTSTSGQNVLNTIIIIVAIASFQTVLDTANTLFDYLHTEDEITSS